MSPCAYMQASSSSPDMTPHMYVKHASKFSQSSLKNVLYFILMCTSKRTYTLPSSSLQTHERRRSLSIRIS